MALLEVENLQTHFRTPDGVNRAVDGVSFAVEAGATIAWVRLV
jgi:peptide/nickel transport system ATP-binding protein